MSTNRATPLAPDLIERILAGLDEKLLARGIDPAEPWPVHLLRLGLPGGRGSPRPCLESIHRWIRSGELAAVRIGRGWFTTRDGVRAWLVRRTTAAGSTQAPNPAEADAASARVAARLARREAAS